MSYTQLTHEQRYQIYALMKVGDNQKKQRKRHGGYIRRGNPSQSSATSQHHAR